MTEGIEPITSLQQIVDLGFTPVRGKTPRTGDAPLEVLWRMGDVSRFPLTASQVRWSIEGHAFDAVGQRPWK